MQFMDVPRQDPPKADVIVRLKDFREIYGQYGAEDAAKQSGRCLSCCCFSSISRM